MQEIISLKNETDKYQVVRTKLEQYGFDSNPVYSGHGLEVYHTDAKGLTQMVVCWSHNEIRINVIEESK